MRWSTSRTEIPARLLLNSNICPSDWRENIWLGEGGGGFCIESRSQTCLLQLIRRKPGSLSRFFERKHAGVVSSNAKVKWIHSISFGSRHSINHQNGSVLRSLPWRAASGTPLGTLPCRSSLATCTLHIYSKSLGSHVALKIKRNGFRATKLCRQFRPVTCTHFYCKLDLNEPLVCPSLWFAAADACFSL